MAIVTCLLQRAVSGGFDSRNRGTYQVEYRWESDSIMGPVGVANGCLAPPTLSPDGKTNSIMPALGANYNYVSEMGVAEVDLYSFALDYSVSFDVDNRKKGTIVLKYTPLEPGEKKENRTETTPTARPTSWLSDEESFTRIIDKDKDGNPIVNAANKSFDRPPTMEDTRGLLVARFNVTTLTEHIILRTTYSNAVNTGTWTVGGVNLTTVPRSVVCRYVRAGQLQNEGGTAYYPISMGFAFKEDGGNWDLEILNEGYGYLDAAGGSYEDAKDKDGSKVSEPVLLAADGTKLADTATGNYITARARKEVDYNAAPLSGYLI